LQAAGSEIAFTTRQMGVPVEGKFGRFSAQVALDPKQPEGGSVSLVIDTASARFGSAELDAEVTKPTWLNAAAFPGQLPVRQHQGHRSRPLRRRRQADHQGLDARPRGPGATGCGGREPCRQRQLHIRRLDFKVGEDEWADTSMLANDVQVRFRLTLAGLPPL